MQIAFQPTMKQRRSAMLRCGVYLKTWAAHLWAPIRRVPAGMFPFGHETVESGE